MLGVVLGAVVSSLKSQDLLSFEILDLKFEISDLRSQRREPQTPNPTPEPRHPTPETNDQTRIQFGSATIVDKKANG